MDADGNGEAGGVIGAGPLNQAVFGHPAAIARTPFLQGGLGMLALAGLAAHGIGPEAAHHGAGFIEAVGNKAGADQRLHHVA